jgi:lipopolysaccharide assembly outer membrane protein LptD (OstA)
MLEEDSDMPHFFPPFHQTIFLNSDEEGDFVVDQIIDPNFADEFSIRCESCNSLSSENLNKNLQKVYSLSGA